MTRSREREIPLPVERPRRLRSSAAMRRLVAETTLRPEHLIAPYFVVPGSGQEQPIAALPGVARVSSDTLLPRLERALELGIRATVLFGVIPSERKSPTGEAADDRRGPVAEALRAARRAFGDDLVLITDVCLCGYTSHGHCGVLAPARSGPATVDNDASLERLAAMALAHAEAGADLVSPSDMMDGRVAALRSTLDRDGFANVGILSYAVKYASAFYGPFREAAGSAPAAATTVSTNGTGADGAPRGPGAALHHDLTPPKDRATYQMDARNAREGLREAALDEREGADMLMVKPALPCLDVIAGVRARTTLPVVAYNVSGEYAMVKAAAAAGALDEGPAVRETLYAIRRAGADLIFTYHAVEALEEGWLG